MEQVDYFTAWNNCALFLGAGASEPFGMPTLQKLGSTVRSSVGISDIFPGNVDVEHILDVLITLQDSSWPVRESLLVQKILEVPEVKKELGKLKPGDIKKNVDEIKSIIQTTYFPRKQNELRKNVFEKYQYFFANLAKACRHGGLFVPASVYTTNYDCCFNSFAQKMKSVDNNFKLNDGFVSSEGGEKLDIERLKRDPSGYEIRLLPMHGNVLWARANDGKIYRATNPKKPRDEIFSGLVVEEMMIYPTREKSYLKSPWFEFLEILREESSKKWIVIGYSFRDEAINNAFLDMWKKGVIKYLILIDPCAEEIAQRLPLREMKEIVRTVSKEWPKVLVDDLTPLKRSYK